MNHYPVILTPLEQLWNKGWPIYFEFGGLWWRLPPP